MVKNKKVIISCNNPEHQICFTKEELKNNFISKEKMIKIIEDDETLLEFQKINLIKEMRKK